jgi:protein-disulfide isomerase
MEENNVNNSEKVAENTASKGQNSSKPIAGAIIIAGVLIAGAILLKGSDAPVSQVSGEKAPHAVTKDDKTLGNPKAKVALILYEDFQCPFCGAVSGEVTESDAIIYLKQNVSPDWAPFMPDVMKYVKEGSVLFVYRDFPFLGPESYQASEAALCAADQGKFWEYHDYLYGHQSGENKGAFSDANLKSFAQTLALDTAAFNSCFDSNKYEQAVLDSKTEASGAGVTGTPKGYILKNGKVVATIDGAESSDTVKAKIDAALK